MVQQPVAYDPTRNPKPRRSVVTPVLNRMAELGYITPALAKKTAAIATKKFLKPTKVRNGCTTPARPFFCDYVSASCAATPRSERRRQHATRCSSAAD